MSIKTAIYVSLGLGASCTCALAGGPSFNCAKATDPDEFAICSNAELSQLDNIANAGYEYVRRVHGAQYAKSITLPLLQARHACGSDVACIKTRQLTAIQKFQSVGAPVNGPQIVQSERLLWDHNGSTVYLVAQGHSRKFFYKEPRPGMLSAGAQPDALIFQGEAIGEQYEGTAYVFNARCGQLPYRVSGPILDDHRRVELRGQAPRVDSNCRNIGYANDLLSFQLIEPSKNTSSNVATATGNPPQPTTSLGSNGSPSGPPGERSLLPVGPSPANFQTTGVVCSNALNGERSGWDPNPTFSWYVAEANRRGLSIGACREQIGLTANVTAPITGAANVATSEENSGRGTTQKQADTSSTIWVFIIIACGTILYVFVKRKRADDNRSQVGVAASHFSDLVGKGIQIKLNAGEPTNIAFQTGEEPLGVFPEMTLVEPRAVREWRSAYGGPSIRIAKGLSWRFGQSQGHSESHEELRDIDVGTLVLTNERIVFAGSKRSSSVPLEKIISVEGFSDALLVHREGKQKTEIYQFSPGKQMTYEYDGHMLATPIDGNLIKAAVDMAIAVHQDLETRAVVVLADGDRLLAQGNLGEALTFYRDSLSIREKLLKANPDKTDAQRALSVSYERIGNVFKQQGNLDEALKFYRDSFAIGKRLAKADPSSTDAQRDLSVWDDRIAGVLYEQGNLDEAMKFYSDGLSIRERWAKTDPGNEEAKRGLMVSSGNIGDVFKKQGNLGEALKFYRYVLASAEQLGEADPEKWTKELQYAVSKIGGLSYHFLLTRDFSQALDVVDQAVSVAPDRIWLFSNRAHALTFLGQVDEARDIYLRYKGHQKVQGEKAWETVILADFAELRNAGLTHPLMDQIEKVFSQKE